MILIRVSWDNAFHTKSCILAKLIQIIHSQELGYLQQCWGEKLNSIGINM